MAKLAWPEISVGSTAITPPWTGDVPKFIGLSGDWRTVVGVVVASL